METFTLVVFLWLAPGEPCSWDHREASTPGLGEGECEAAAKLVAPRQGHAWCFIEGRPEPSGADHRASSHHPCARTAARYRGASRPEFSSCTVRPLKAHRLR
jgi:hypothetical protein